MVVPIINNTVFILVRFVSFSTITPLPLIVIPFTTLPYIVSAISYKLCDKSANFLAFLQRKSRPKVCLTSHYRSNCLKTPSFGLASNRILFFDIGWINANACEYNPTLAHLISGFCFCRSMNASLYFVSPHNGI